MNNKQTKFLQVVNYLIPGFSYQENIYCNLLSKDKEFDNYIISVAKNYPNGGGYEKLSCLFTQRDIIPGEYEEENIRSIRLRSFFEKNYKIWLVGLIGEIKKIDPDVILIHGISNISTIRVCLYKFIFRKNFKLLVDDHMIQTIVNKSIVSRIYNMIVKFVFSPILNRTIDIYLPISQETEGIVKKLYGANGKFEILLLGANDEIFYCDKIKRESFRSDHNIKDDDMVLIYTGKIIESKKVDIIVQAFSKCVKNNIKLKLFLVGVYDLEYYNKLTRIISELQLNDNIIFFENVSSSKLAEFYNGSDLGLWPFSETISVVEAQLCGLPVILNNSIVSRERIGYNSTAPSGLLMKNNFDQITELSDFITKLVKDQDELRKFKRNALLNSSKYKNSIIINQLKSCMK